MRKIQVLAVDFDGTICHSVYPDATDINLTAIDVLKRFRNHGGEIILWTCRKGQALDNAVKACLNAGLEFDAVNAEAPRQQAAWLANHAEDIGVTPSPKVYADMYIDDHSRWDETDVDWSKIDKRINSPLNFNGAEEDIA